MCKDEEEIPLSQLNRHLWSSNYCRLCLQSSFHFQSSTLSHRLFLKMMRYLRCFDTQDPDSMPPPTTTSIYFHFSLLLPLSAPFFVSPMSKAYTVFKPSSKGFKPRYAHLRIKYRNSCVNCSNLPLPPHRDRENSSSCIEYHKYSSLLFFFARNSLLFSEVGYVL